MRRGAIPIVVVVAAGLVYVAFRQDTAPPEPQAPAQPAERTVPSGASADVEAATKAFEAFAQSLRDASYEQAWNLTSRFFQTRKFQGFDQFRAAMEADGAILASYTVQPGSARPEGEFVRLLVQSKDAPVDLYLYFIKEEGQWKLHHAQETRDIDGPAQ